MGAVIGAAISAGTSVVQQASSGKPINWGEVGKQAVVGAVTGAITGLVGPEGGPLAMAAIGALSGAAGQATSNALEGKPLTEGLAQAALLGGAGGAAGALGGKLLSGGAKALSKALGSAEKEAVAAAEGNTTNALKSAAKKGGCNSFDPTTPVATPDGTKPIGDIQVGETVMAYDPTTGQAKAEPVEHVFINHDTNLLDVTLAPFTTTTTPATQDDAISPKEAHAALVSHGTRAPPTSQPETLHTTTEHPFLTTDRGFVDAVKLRVGEQVQQLDGRVGVVVVVTVTLGAAVRYNLTVRELHTYAVGDGKWVVHNTECPWTSPSVKRAAADLDFAAGKKSISVQVESKSEAEELFLNKFQGEGYKNTTGMDATAAKDLFGSKEGTYHWDDGFDSEGTMLGHSSDNPHANMPHLQIHSFNDSPFSGGIIRIFYPK